MEEIKRTFFYYYHQVYHDQDPTDPNDPNPNPNPNSHNSTILVSSSSSPPPPLPRLGLIPEFLPTHLVIPPSARPLLADFDLVAGRGISSSSLDYLFQAHHLWCPLAV